MDTKTIITSPDLQQETQILETSEVAGKSGILKRIGDIVDRVKTNAKIITMAAALSFSMGSCIENAPATAAEADPSAEIQRVSLNLEMSNVYDGGFIAKFSPIGKKIEVMVDPDKGPAFSAQIQENGTIQESLEPGVQTVYLHFINVDGNSVSITLEKQKADSLDF